MEKYLNIKLHGRVISTFALYAGVPGLNLSPQKPDILANFYSFPQSLQESFGIIPVLNEATTAFLHILSTAIFNALILCYTFCPTDNAVKQIINNINKPTQDMLTENNYASIYVSMSVFLCRYFQIFSNFSIFFCNYTRTDK